MDFSKRKLPVEATSRLRMCPIDTVKPYALMIAPVYVYLRRNEKYVSVKAPLDFFTPEELARLRSCEMLFMPDFVDEVQPYRQLAHRVRTVLAWTPCPPSFELTDAVLRVSVPFWGKGQRIESFFVSVFAGELCSLLPAVELVAAREKDAQLFERAVTLSAWVVFLMLHIGAANQAFLDALRLHVFRLETGISVPALMRETDAAEIHAMMREALEGPHLHEGIGIEFFESRPERAARKILGRIRRVQESLADEASLHGTIYGERGFVDV